jgi:hypothetical protein
MLVLLVNSGCRNGRIPCPEIGGKRLSFFSGKFNLASANEGPAGQRVAFTKNGLIKKKNYNYLRNKRKRKKYK